MWFHIIEHICPVRDLQICQYLGDLGHHGKLAGLIFDILKEEQIVARVDSSVLILLSYTVVCSLVQNYVYISTWNHSS